MSHIGLDVVESPGGPFRDPRKLVGGKMNLRELLLAILFLAACGDDPSNAPDEMTPEPDAGRVTSPGMSADAELTVPPPTDQPRSLQKCQSDLDCETGLACEHFINDKRCQEPLGLPDGDACLSSTDCHRNTCLDWPGGYCTTSFCSADSDCSLLGEDNQCLIVRGDPICVRVCESMDDCRTGYSCQLVGETQYCVPGTLSLYDGFANHPFDSSCTTSESGESQLSFLIDPSTIHYTVTPYRKDAGVIGPLRIRDDDTTLIELEHDNGFMTFGQEIYGNIVPTQVPATADRSEQLQPGLNRYHVTSSAGEVCRYVIEESTVGTTIDLNIYLVGAPVNEDDPMADPNIEVVLGTASSIFDRAGFRIGQVRFPRLADDVVAAYRIIRSESALTELAQHSRPPGETRYEALSLNVFLVEGLALNGVLGVSLGIPGLAGVHGTKGSAVIITSELLGDLARDGSGTYRDGNAQTGLVLAHEMGHFMGLFHTTEADQQRYDHLDDTPECVGDWRNCADIQNLMFPFAGFGQNVLTPGQRFVLGANPLTKDPPAP